MYKTKEIDHEKRKNQEGSYSLYNHLYHFLLDNFEPQNLDASIAAEAAEKELIKEGKAYCIKGGNAINETELKGAARQAICNFCNNDGSHGDTANNLGKMQSNSFENIKNTISDLRW